MNSSHSESKAVSLHVKCVHKLPSEVSVSHVVQSVAACLLVAISNVA